MNIYKAKSSVAILAGGMGTRLKERSGGVPKPMVKLLGKPVLQYQIELCRKYGFCNILLLVHHQNEIISEYFGDGDKFGVSINYLTEKEPRGTYGALYDALPNLEDRFLVLYGDTYLDVDLRKFWDAHITSDAIGTLLIHPNDHPHDSDLVKVNSENIIQTIHSYPHRSELKERNLVNAALYVLEKTGLQNIEPLNNASDIAKYFFTELIKKGNKLQGYITPEYIKDMGTPERLDKVVCDINNGLTERLSSRKLRSAIFLDRDGTLIREKNHLISPDQLELLPGVASSIKNLNCNGKLVVLITNQPVVARGEIELEDLELIHNRLEFELGVEGAYIDRIYFCPHHPDKGFLGEVSELKVECLCRKPKSGLIDKACKDLSIDRSTSWMIGDTTTDVETGRRAGLRTILLRTGYGGRDIKYFSRPNYVCTDIEDAVNWVLCGHNEMKRRVAPLALKLIKTNRRLILIGGLARSGKSFAAEVLRELLGNFDITAHVISLDGWLKERMQRQEGAGVCDRYKLSEAAKIIIEIMNSKSRQLLIEPIYDRVTGVSGSITIEHSIGPEDILIVEGVPALLINELTTDKNSLNVYIDVKASLRQERLYKDYNWRGIDSDKINKILKSREFDEIPQVVDSRKIADYIIK